MSAYELTYIVRPDMDEEQVQAAVGQITDRLESAEAEIVAVLPWNPPRRRMAYPIRDFGDGFYVTTVFHVESAALPPLENFLKLNERVLRYLLVQATDLNIKQAQQRLQQQQAAAAAPRPQPAPAAAPSATAAGAGTTETGPEPAETVAEAPATPEPAANAEAEAEATPVAEEQPAPVEAEAVAAESTTETEEAPGAEPVGVAGESAKAETEE